jgi:hypothetical protein
VTTAGGGSIFRLLASSRRFSDRVFSFPTTLSAFRARFSFPTAFTLGSTHFRHFATRPVHFRHSPAFSDHCALSAFCASCTSTLRSFRDILRPTTFIQHSLPQFPQPSFAFSDISEWRTSADCHRILRQFLQTLFLTLRTFPLYDPRRLLSVLAPRP